MPRVVPKKWVDPKTGEITLEALQYLDYLENGGSGNPAIGTLLSGINSVTATASGIIDGTVAIDPTITGRGTLADELDSVGVNVGVAASAAASGGALSAFASPTYAYGSIVGTGDATTNAVTVTASGGTGPYTYAWAKKSGIGTITANLPTAASTDFTGTLTLSNQQRSHVWTCMVTDAAAATVAVDVSVFIESFGTL